MTRAALPAENGSAVTGLRRKIVAPGSANHPTTSRASEHFLASGENVVQRVLEVRRRLREFLPDLLDVFLVTLLDLLAEQLLQRSRSHPFVAFLRMIRNHVRNEGARESLRLLIWIVGEKRVDRRLSGRRGNLGSAGRSATR